MSRKPKVIETPGDSLPVTEAAKVVTHLMEKPARKSRTQPAAAAPAPQVLQRRAGWVLTEHGWIKE